MKLLLLTVCNSRPDLLEVMIKLMRTFHPGLTIVVGSEALHTDVTATGTWSFNGGERGQIWMRLSELASKYDLKMVPLEVSNYAKNRHDLRVWCWSRGLFDTHDYTVHLEEDVLPTQSIDLTFEKPRTSIYQGKTIQMWKGAEPDPPEWRDDNPHALSNDTWSLIPIVRVMTGADLGVDYLQDDYHDELFMESFDGGKLLHLDKSSWHTPVKRIINKQKLVTTLCEHNGVLPPERWFDVIKKETSPEKKIEHERRVAIIRGKRDERIGPCKYRREALRKEECITCKKSEKVKEFRVFKCTLFKECSIARNVGVRVCIDCQNHEFPLVSDAPDTSTSDA